MNQNNNKDNDSSKKLPPAVPPPPPPRPTADGPIFRSVAVAAPQSELNFGSAIPQPKSFTVPPPPQSFSSSPRVWPKDGNTKPLVKPSPVSGDWSWKVEKLDAVPVFHLLERTAVHIKSTPLETVTTRISNCLKNNSITTSYQNARVDCLADSLLKFSVQLWQGSDSSTTTVEIQRKQGCCIEMQRIRALIAEAAQFGNVEIKQDHAETACSVVQKLMNNTPLPTPVDQDCVGSALAIGVRMLESKRLDENRMALESLCTLTDSSKVIATDAQKAASTVLSDSNLQGLLERYFVQMKLSGHESDMSDNDTMDYEDGQFVGCCHILSLRLLANALESGEKSSIKLDLSSQFWTVVLRALYYNANVASARPLEASLSIKSLRLLQTMEPACLRMAPSEQGLYDVLASAHQFGRQHNHSLEVESKRLMGQLDSLPVY